MFFKEPTLQRPNLDGVELKKLFLEDMISLEVPFGEEEVKEVFWQSANDKSPCNDGFNMNFFKACWDILKKDILNSIKEFFHSFKLLRSLTSSFLTLILKIENPQSLEEYSPICLITSIYRIL